MQAISASMHPTGNPAADRYEQRESTTTLNGVYNPVTSNEKPQNFLSVANIQQRRVNRIKRLPITAINNNIA